MTNQLDETRFPAVDRLRETLRADLMRAARTNPRMRPRFFRRRRVMAVVVALLAVTPAALAGAGVFDSPDNIEYECSEKKQHEDSKVVVGAPVEGPGAPGSVRPEAPTQPEDPCD
jgi:hypothetical protein